MNRETGQALLLALMVLAAGALIVGPLLGLVSTSLRALQVGDRTFLQYYAADSGVEHAIWRLSYELGFAASLVAEEPFPYYLTLNGVPVEVQVTRKALPGAGESPLARSDRLQVAKTVEPPTAPLGVATLFTFTILVENVGTSNIHIEEIGDSLPQGFVYQPGSSGGAASFEPLIQDNELVWQFSSPLPSVEPGETMAQVFQAGATLEEGVYYDEAWVKASPQSIATVATGPTAPIVPSGERYNIQSQAGSVTIQAALRIADRVVTVLSWGIR